MSTGNAVSSLTVALSDFVWLSNGLLLCFKRATFTYKNLGLIVGRHHAFSPDTRGESCNAEQSPTNFECCHYKLEVQALEPIRLLWNPLSLQNHLVERQSKDRVTKWIGLPELKKMLDRFPFNWQYCALGFVLNLNTNIFETEIHHHGATWVQSRFCKQQAYPSAIKPCASIFHRDQRVLQLLWNGL